MRDFIKGWKRKTGCVSLVLALMTTSIWIRSLMYQDAFFLSLGGDSSLAIATADGYASFVFPEPACKGCGPLVENFPFWINRPITEENGNEFHVTNVIGAPRTVPYWMLEVPLVLLSAFLILWKAREGNVGRDRSGKLAAESE